MSDTVINLKPNQAAFILDEKWNLELHVPKHEDDEFVPNNVIYVSMLAILTKHDEEFVKEMLEKFESWADFFDNNRKE